MHLLFYNSSFSVCELAKKNHDEIYKCPDSASACRKKLCDTCSSLTYIEPVDSKVSKEEAEKKAYKPFS